METSTNKTVGLKSQYSYLVFGLCPLSSAACPNLIWSHNSFAQNKKCLQNQ